MTRTTAGPAGKYDRRLTWSRHSYGSPTATGAKPDVYASQGDLWASVEDLTASAAEVMDSTQPVVRAVIRVRGYPAVAALDRLTDTRFGDTYTVNAVRRGDLELVCEAARDPVSRYPGNR